MTHIVVMRIISRRRLREFWFDRPIAEEALRGWFQRTKRANWNKFADVKATFASVDVYGKCHVFNVGGNKYRIIAGIHFNTHRVYIRHVLTHAEYDTGKWKTDCEGE